MSPLCLGTMDSGGPTDAAESERILLADEDHAAFDALVHPGTAVADFHNSTGWMRARVGG